MNTWPNALYNAEQTRLLDQIAIQDMGVQGFELMNRAAQAVFNYLQQHYANSALIIFCGVGNNAGDAYLVASLALAQNYDVTVCQIGDISQLKGDAERALQTFLNHHGHLTEWNELKDCQSGTVIIDGLLGTGLNRPVSGLYLKAIEWINRQNVPVISIDIPSGLNATTGVVMGNAVQACHTITFIALKTGLLTGMAPDYCGTIEFAGLQIPSILFDRVPATAFRISEVSMSARQRTAHKGHFGHVLLIGGDCGFSGAILLAAEAALRTGAGLVSVATRRRHSAYLTVGRPELMCHAVENEDELKPLLAKATVVVIGPGLGQSNWAKMLFNQVVQEKKPLVCDADALNILAETPHFCAHWVLTPHPGEAGRLLGCETAQINQDRFQAAQQIQHTYGGITVLKGAGTLIRNTEETHISTTGNPGMATGGMGDVLAGMIGGIMAQKFAPYQAVCIAVYLHGQAADKAAKQGGERGLLAQDLMPFIRQGMNS